MKKPITIVSSICFLLFLIAIVWLGAGIYTDKKNGSERADSRFSSLLESTQKNFQENQYGTYQFSNNFIKAIGNIDDFSTLKLEINGELVYSYPPEFFTLPSPDLVKSYSQTIYSGEKSLTLKASIYLMKPGSVYNHSRLAFILILFGTVFAGIFILILSGKESDSSYSFKSRRHSHKSYSDFIKESDSQKSEEPEEKNESTEPAKKEVSTLEKNVFGQEKLSSAPKPIFNPEAHSYATESSKPSEAKDEKISINFDEPNEQPQEQEISIDFDEPNSDDKDFSDEEDDLDIIDQMEMQNEQDSFFADDDSENDSEETLDFEDTPAITFEEPLSESEEDTNNDQEEAGIQKAPLPEIEEPSAQNTNSQVSPISNLFLQNSLADSFDKIIQSGKNQATLALIKINGLDRGNAISQKIISILKEKTKTAGIFEYKGDAYAVILPDSDLQTTVDKFEQIYNEIADFLKNNNATNEVSVGISSASARTEIKAERIILEADQALNYASGDPDSPIVAFRVKA